MPLFVGTSGFTLQHFYPATVPSAEKLRYYASIFNTVEINSTFYHVPRLTTLQRWQALVPSDFVFTFKVFQGLTHEGANEINSEVLKKWFTTFDLFATENSQHCMLFQFPASRSFNQKYFESLLKVLPPTFLYAFEFRHPSWYVDEVFQILHEKGSTIVLADSPVKKNGHFLWPKYDFQNTSFSYIRFHGAPELYRSSYSSEQLEEYQPLITSKLAKGEKVYVYFNNDAEAHAAENAVTLQKLIKVL